MAATYVTVVIQNVDGTNDSNNQLLFQQDASLNVINGVHDGIQSVINYLLAIQSGSKLPSTVQVTTRTSDPAVSTNGTHSTQVTYSKI